ncbi:hypothetical protein [Curtobacterium sp. Leaf261]|uniref:hypothetical protein n=1 Tax=Curtobacterium sp. Leaf261 TaxID=1736311 RepID=UPI00138F9C25|nr:hypothetical protein [Curtobacterium sp. Leaf261]
MEILIEFPLDADGFLRRECPHCEQEFKWYHGPTDEAPADFVYGDTYFCPRCGRAADPDQWFTQEQISYQEAVVAAAAPGIIADAIEQEFKSSRNSGMTFKRGKADGPAEPDPLVEPDDMAMLAPPCHPWEPVKVPNDAVMPVHCLLCGQAFAV